MQEENAGNKGKMRRKKIGRGRLPFQCVDFVVFILINAGAWAGQLQAPFWSVMTQKNSFPFIYFPSSNFMISIW
jgi:hypothetical protein